MASVQKIAFNGYRLFEHSTLGFVIRNCLLLKHFVVIGNSIFSGRSVHDLGSDIRMIFIALPVFEFITISGIGNLQFFSVLHLEDIGASLLHADLKISVEGSNNMIGYDSSYGAGIGVKDMHIPLYITRSISAGLDPFVRVYTVHNLGGAYDVCDNLYYDVNAGAYLFCEEY